MGEGCWHTTIALGYFMSEFHCPYWSSFVPTCCEFLSKRSQVVGQLLWLLKKQLLNRHTNGFQFPSLYLQTFPTETERVGWERFSIKVGNREPPFQLEWWRDSNPGVTSCTWLHVTARDCMWLHVTTCGCMWLYMWLWLHVTTYDYMWLHVTVTARDCDYMWLHVTIHVTTMCQHMTTCDYMWLDMWLDMWLHVSA